MRPRIRFRQRLTLFLPSFEDGRGVEIVALFFISERADNPELSRVRIGRRHNHSRTQYPAVSEGRLEEFAQRLLKLGFTAGSHTTSNGDVNGHIWRSVFQRAKTLQDGRRSFERMSGAFLYVSTHPPERFDAVEPPARYPLSRGQRPAPYCSSPSRRGNWATPSCKAGRVQRRQDGSKYDALRK